MQHSPRPRHPPRNPSALIVYVAVLLLITIIRRRLILCTRLITILIRLLRRYILRIPPHQLPHTKILNETLHKRLRRLVLRTSLLPTAATLRILEPSPDLTLVREFRLVVVQRHGVNLFEYGFTFLARVWEEEFEGDGRAETFADDGEEELDPAHEVVEEVFAFGVNFVDEVVEGLFVSLDEVDECLNGPLRVDLAD